ncbi:hypothetical protein N7468_009110 [Penicillium chermesinum]|uniref:Ubiquitin-conjugating enzyme E2-binding protein n=1 Tax=Penicillium chermesinum TaxID=63820 RepID=A0A9W9TEN4_9EURO|nr:uncharacterized protein N7468_009110 [Penicillium chermesinum]KAJ5219906.1 hypothetical protein N7468_009110 [Penicillium chermesinum]
MLSINWPSLRSLRLFSWEKQPLKVSPVKIHDIDSAQENPGRALKHLLRLNHANYAILYNDRKFHNHAPHILCAAFLQGADADDLTRMYETESKLLDAWEDSPAEVTAEDWREHLGHREYQKAFVDFFEDELVRYNYEWKEVVAEYLFSGENPIFHSIMADLGHPLIHLAYAFEMSSREKHKYLADPAYTELEPSYRSKSVFEIFEKVRTDKKFDGLFATAGDDNFSRVFQTHEAALLDHWNAWTIENPIEQFRESQELAATLFAAAPKDSIEKYDFFLVHVLTTSHAVRVLLPFVPAHLQIPLVRQWWLVTLAIFIAQLRPELSLNRVRETDLRGRDWDWVSKQAVKGEYSTDAHYVKALRCLNELSSTWGDHDQFYLKAASVIQIKTRPASAEQLAAFASRMLSPPDTPLYLHAELLPNIRQITLYVSLPSHPALNGLHPTIQLSDSRKAVTVSLPHPFQDVTETTKLPARVSEAALLAPSDELTDDYVPWTAGDMSPDTRIRCRSCSAELLNTTPPQRTSQDETSGGGWDWKDLPSGNWAEMMDFWHCHKPDPHEEDAEPEANAALRVEEQNAQIKGYGASSRVVATTGTVLVDTATFLLAERDCGGLKKTSEEKPSNLHDPEQRSLACTSCNAVLGTEDPSVNGWRLLKAHVSISTNQSIQSYSAEVIIAAQLLELIERESARRFVVHSGQKSGLLLWVFNPDLRYSNVSAGHAVNNQQAMKVLYQALDDVDTVLNRDMGRPSPLSVEELELPISIFESLSNALHASNCILPFSARRFNEWQVGLLSRFSRST